MRPHVGPGRLLRLQLRLWASSSRQWLFSVGLMPDRDAAALGYAYAFYALALGLLWIGSSWGALVTLTLEVARAMPQAVGQGLGRSLPSLFGLGLVVLSVLALLGMPLHLSGADVAHVGGARVSRRMLAILRFLPAALGAAAIALPLGTVLAVLSTQSPRHYLVAMAVLLPLVVGAYAAYWAIGLARLSLGSRLARAALWLIPLALLATLALHAGLALWPGQLFAQAALHGTVPQADLTAWLALGLILMLGVAGFVDWTRLLDRSLRRNLLRAIDAGRRWNPAIAAQQRRAAILSRRRPYLHLPTWQGPSLLMARGPLARLRYPPSLWGLVRAATIILGGLNLAIFPVRGDAWLLWLLLVFVYPPLALVEDFQMDTDPLWHQFLGLDPLRLLLWDALLPAGIVVLAGMVELLLLHLAAGAALSAFLLLLGLVALAGLSQAVGAAGGRRARRIPLPDLLPAAVGYGLFALVGVAAHAVLLAALLLLAYSALLGRVLADRA